MTGHDNLASFVIDDQYQMLNFWKIPNVLPMGKYGTVSYKRITVLFKHISDGLTQRIEILV